MDYTICSAEALDELEEDVRDLMINEGWRPQGGVFWARGLAMQALVRDVAQQAGDGAEEKT